MFRKTYVKINNKNLTNNIKEIISKYNNYKFYFGVVKGNAYGHGDYIVNDLIKGGINYLAVSSLEEAISIRKYNKEIPILCLEPINLEYIKDILDNNVTITIENIEYVKELIDKKIDKQLKVHIKLDTGMSRLGFTNKEELNESINLLKENNNILLEGIYTHMATSGINDVYYDKQISKFKYLTEDINLKEIPIVHIGRSMTLVNHSKLDFVNGVRLGICMYGFNNSIPTPTGLKKFKRDRLLKKLNISETTLTNNLNLKTAFSLYTEVMSIRKIKQGSFVGYGANYIANENIIVATLPIGYVDGMNKYMKYVSINNNKYEIIGDICMDMTMIKIDDTIKLHDKVEIFGDNISIREVSRRLNTNAYHVVTGITTRVPRVYDNDIEIKY